MNEQEKKSSFEDTPEGWAKRWEAEMAASQKMLKPYHKKGDKVVERYLDDRGEGESEDSRVNLFWSHVKRLKNVMFANLPKVDVGRKFDDQDDDVARVSALIMNRLLNYDIAENGLEYESVLRSVLEDRLLPGLGGARVFYEYSSEMVQHEPIMHQDEFGEEYEAAPGYEEESISDEHVTIGYYHWRDIAWGWTRTWKDVPWVGFRNFLDKDEVEERFGKKAIKQLSFKKQTLGTDEGVVTRDEEKALWEKAEIWEIWDKSTRRVFWWSQGCKEILDEKEDPLDLKGFFPCPPFLMANTTTTWMMPKPDFYMAQDLYNEIDILNTRISILTQAVKVIGVYDKSSDGVKRMFQEGVENELIPVDNWAMFAEKGGIQGQVDWLPIEAVVNAIINLRQLRDDNVIMLEKVTGMSDILQGSGTHPREGVGTQQMKAEFGSVDIQALQEEFTNFAKDLLELKAEVISRHCQPESIMALANVEGMNEADKELIQPAIQLLKDWSTSVLKIKIRSETMSMVDYTRLKAERTEFINGMALFMQSSAPLVEMDPSMGPVLLEIFKWTAAGYRGSSEIEGVLDKAIEAMKQSQQQPGQEAPDPDLAKIEAEKQAEIELIHAKTQAELQTLQAKFMARIQEIEAKAAAEQNKEATQAEFNTMEKEMELIFNSALKELESSLRRKEINDKARVSPSKKSGG